MNFNAVAVAKHKNNHEHCTNASRRGTNAAHSLPVISVADVALLLMIVTSDTLTAQPLQYVSPDCAKEGPLLPIDHEYEPIMMLVVPPYTCKKTWYHMATHAQ